MQDDKIDHFADNIVQKYRIISCLNDLFINLEAISIR